ncbi:hypothetical protein LZ575_19180 [Antarcticibacterium sp. 1MA-6-2]|uniref:hypothetical protein n=1 Tax=Antarcticibacterium sp. 1MA-6-2 TaxID=2908210 RepID=UPI001F38871C|nr:hypothetical protein [Antarcticibacterium sp. 1MA-6-2]UJH90830.1 hypothetical protein LZ575_19180 [Antarcticibacterium sp. 1MA-6-2]
MGFERNLEDLEFTLDEIFPNCNFWKISPDNRQLHEGTKNPKHIITPADLDEELAQRIAGHMGLSFIADKDQFGNVCMAESAEVIPAFRQICTGNDILNYIIAVINTGKNSEEMRNPEKIKSIQIAFPKNAMRFWELVKPGEKLTFNLYKE